MSAPAFDRRLDPTLKTPIAVAFSGGGDSLAALLLTQAWADRHGRRVLALHVDHRIQSQSAAWTAFAADAAARIGADFRPLLWDGPKPALGLPAAARAARHGLIADAARQAGARVVVFGHTADDSLEADLMRAEGSNLGALREWSPSPVWPEGRGIFLLRPLLRTRRSAIRDALRAAGEAWIDDPANVDPRSTRARARFRLSGTEGPNPPPDDDERLADLAGATIIAPEGFLRIGRERLRRAPTAAARRCLAAGVLCAGGGERPPRGARLDRLLSLALGPEPFQATLSGAKIVADEDILLARDAGEARRGGLATVDLTPGCPAVWDGRFEIKASGAGLRVGSVGGSAPQLGKKEGGALRALPPAVRPGLPLITRPDGPPTCPILARDLSVEIRSLISARFLAACGAISKEPAT
jgi:tRNA(Ile)-lysidine synthase